LSISGDVAFRELEHEAIDLLSFSRKAECLQKYTNSIHEAQVPEIQKIDKSMHDSNIVFISAVR
jgi:hypothetical protein